MCNPLRDTDPLRGHAGLHIVRLVAIWLCGTADTIRQEAVVGAYRESESKSPTNVFATADER